MTVTDMFVALRMCMWLCTTVSDLTVNNHCPCPPTPDLQLHHRGDRLSFQHQQRQRDDDRAEVRP
eukprot:17063-Eustigmatos_ZCMA.PRE.1